MNVLVYSGPESLQISLNHALSSLRSILVPHYTVQPITKQALLNDPWQKSCALLVLPQSRGQNRFTSSASKQIKDFVETGGSCVIFGTSASAFLRSGGLGLGATTLSLGQQEETPLKFYDKLNNCHVTLDEGGSKDPQISSLKTPSSMVIDGIYSSKDAALNGFEVLKGVSILAQYPDQDTKIAGLSMDVGAGRLAIWAPSIEYPLSDEPLSSLITASSQLSSEAITKYDKLRGQLIRTTLSQLGLQVPEERQTVTRPLPQFLTSIPSKPHIVSQILEAIASPSSGSQLTVLKDSNDEFFFHILQESSEVLKTAREDSQFAIASDPSTWQPKHIIICRDGDLPGRDLTPLFDLELYYKSLTSMRKEDALESEGSYGIGEALLYGEVVTSTQTMLDKNTHLLSTLPAPLLSLASYQLAGRGRGSNVWLSPSGCLQFSLLLHVNLSDLPAHKLVFIQYLFSLAVVEACRDETVLGDKAGDKIQIKWPNDIYALVGSGNDDIRKIGGVLVNTSFTGKRVDLVIGCGLNVLNLPPITSLSQLHTGNKVSLSMERTAAAIMTKFESMWSIFLKNKGSFESFNKLYLERWLHSDQLVTLTTTTPHTRVRIVGITPDYGLLRTLPERPNLGRFSGREEDYIDLQPDGNSFDLMANLIKSKS